MPTIEHLIAQELGISPAQVTAVVAFIDEGNTIPFIARYRKEATGGLDDVTLRDLDERLAYLRALEARKAEVLSAIEEQGKLTADLREKIDAATVMQRVEDLYKPFKKKRATRASKAREAGLEPLAVLMMGQATTQGDPLALAAPYVNAAAGYDTPEAALQGAQDIVAETIADDAEHVATLRTLTRRQGALAVEAADATEKTVYESYYDFAEPLSRIPNHRILAINRGEKEGKLKVRVRTDADVAVATLEKRVVRRANSVFTSALRNAVSDAYKRLVAPALERELRTELTERAQTDAIRVFAKNTESLLSQRPVRGARVIALDPGYRTGCKVAVLDEYGKLLDHGTVFPTPPRREIEQTKRTLADLVRRHQTNVIVIGNGTGSRETEEVVADFIAETDAGAHLQYTIVNEAGASVYSASKLASEEYPDLDVTTRGAMSLGRRLQDPLAELVKIPPQSIGVGQYQHDLNQAALGRALTGVVENVVNRVGVNLNTASPSLLAYVSGVSAAVAKNIVAYREEHGAFTDRRELKKVSKLGAKAFQNCAGFLRIEGGANPLDATSVHPESYPVAREVLKRAGVKPEALAHGGIPDIAQRVGDLPALAQELGAGLPTLRDIVAELEKPGRDPRDDAPPVVFSRSVRDFDDLTPGMELTGTVRNVVDFGAFVDIGVKQDGLVHISKLADRFVRHPSEVVSVGDTVTVWVTSVDKDRGKISLTMVKGKE
ncbi:MULTISPECIES: Tex family protein [Gordonibacter]|uniref:Tex family protein n=1 Tax=Gordonibacter faecis TaxID=3047475 RepID=A0ABT7DNK3_9ACTN|nr:MULTISPECIES: Tex family protein [unclassified Gordonibacter]MDJ1650807.1 Tex family protein [Gordonibacter sp. KGMB12511]HIW77163.1 RNA-binding transcriptional accessory protein [Candidatus Gordonibacter avicola]